VATTTFSSGLSYANGNVTNTGVLSVGPTGQASNGNILLATSTSVTNGLTSALNIVGSGATMTFTPSLSGTLTAGGGGTGISNPTAAGVLLGSYAGGSYQQLATSSLGLLTTNVAEGSNLYYTDARVQAFVHASTTIPKTYTSNTFTNTNTFSGSSIFNGGVTIGSLNGPLQANAGVVSATTSIGVLYGGTGLSSAPSYGNVLVGNSAGGYTLTATSSLGLITSAIQSLGAQYSTALTGSAQTFATTSDTNIGLVITSSGSTHTFTPTFTGTLADSRVADNLTISGGTIDNSPIGASTASTGIFTSATTTNATTTTLSVSSASKFSGSATFPGAATFSAGVIFTQANGSFTINGLNGPLDARNGVVSATTSIGVLYGGTGLTSSPSYGNILVGNSSGGYTLTATSSLGLITAALTSIGPTGQTTTGPTVTLATTTSTTNGLTSALTIVGSGSTMTFTPSQSGTLTAGGGGTGISNPTAAGILLGSYAGGAWQQLATSSLGLLTTNVNEGSNLYYTDTRVNTYINGSSTIPKTYTNNTFTGNNTFNGTLTFGSLNGPLDARNGVVGATTSIGVLYGGTGLTSAPSYGNILVGNSAGGYTLTATSSLGLVTAALTSIGPTGQTTTGPAVTLATSTSVTNGITSALNIVGSGSTMTFTPSQSGTLTAGGGGTGISNPTAAGVLVGSYAGGSYQQLATSSLGLLTTNVAEGSNLYYLDSRVQSFVHASTTIPKTYTSNTFSNTNTFSGSSIFNGGVTIGSLNGPLDARNGVVGATTSVGVLYGGTGATSFGQGWVYSLGGTGALAASTSPTINYLVATSTSATSTFAWGVQANALNVTSSTASSTFANGINLSAGCFAINNTCLSTSGSGITLIGPTGQTTAGPTVTLATSTSVTNGITSALNIVGSGSTMTFTPSQSGTLTAGGGGTGISNPTAAGVLVGSYAGGSYQQIATSSLGLLTTNVTEGSNLYYLDSRVQAFVHGSTTIPKTYTSNTFSNTNTFSGASIFNGGVTIGTLNGPLDARNGVVGATTSIGVLYGGTGLTSSPSYGNILVGNASNGYTLTATSSLGLITTLGAQYSTGQTGTTQTFATSTDTNLVLTITSSGNTHTFAPSWTGSLAANRGGTGITNPTAAGILLGSYAGGSYQQLATSSLGLITTNVNEGSNLYYLDSRVQSFIHASTTIPKTYTNNTFTGNNIFNGTLTFGTLNGPLDARNGVVGATTSIGVLYGGTGLTSAPSYGNILVGNSSGGYTLTATSSLGLITAALTSIGPTGQTTTGPAVTLATTTSTTNGLTSALTIVGSGSTMTFTPSQSGTLTAGGGGTGISNPTAAGVLVGSYAGGSYQQIATSSLGLLTTNVAEGSNLYYLDSRVQSFVHGSTTIPKTYTSNTFTGANTFSSTLTLTGLNGPLDARNGVVGATTSIGVLYGGTGATSFGQGWIYSLGGTGALAASTSPTINYLVATSTTATSTFAAGLQTTALNITSSTASSTFANGISLSAGCFAINNTCLSTSGSGITSIGPTGQTSAGPTITLATTTSTTNGLTSVLTIVGSGSTMTFTPSQSGTLTAGGGGTGISNPTAAGILLGSYAGGSWQQLATSSLGLLTTNVAEGSNQYFTNGRAQSATGWIDNGTTVTLVTNSDNVGVGTSTPYAKLTAWGAGTGSNRVFELANNASTTLHFVQEDGTAYFLGNVGIATTSPYVKLSVEGASVLGNSATAGFFVGTTTSTSTFAGAITVAGQATSTFSKGVQATALNITSSTASSTFANGLNLSGGCYAINNACVGGTGGSGTVNTGAQNALAYYPSAGTTVDDATGLFWDNSNTRLGIGTSSPYAKLSVVGEVAAAYFTATSTTATSSFFGGVTIGDGTEGDSIFQMGIDANAWSMGYVTSDKTFRIASSTGLTTAVALAIAKGGNVGIGGTTTPSQPLSVAGNAYFDSNIINFASSTATGVNLDFDSRATTTIMNGTDNAWSIATSTTNVPIFSISTRSSPLGLIGIGSSSPMGKFSIEMGTVNPAFIVSNLGSSSPSLIVTGVNQNGTVGIGTSTPWKSFSVVGDIAFATSTTALNAAFSMQTSTTTGNSTTTIGFFTATSTGLISGVGLGVPNTIKNYVIVGNGKDQAGIGIVNGGICVDNDGWCTASTTGRITARSSFLTSGADVAEMYRSADDLEAGDIVMTSGTDSVARANIQSKVIGIVSTQASLIIGGNPDSDENQNGSYPIALSGRVPVKVSTENGPIFIGDDLTLSTTTPGVGVRARAGDVIVGKALENFSSITQGKILAFVHIYKNTDLSSEIGAISSSASSTKISIDEISAALAQSSAVVNSITNQLTSLIETVSGIHTSVASTSDKLTNLSSRIAALEIATSTEKIPLAKTGTITWKGLDIDSIGTGGEMLALQSDLVFIGRPYFNNDTGGFVVIKKGAKTAEVTFEKEYIEQPVVNASISLEDATTTESGAEDLIFNNNMSYVITKKSKTGFSIILNKSAPTDMTFSWIALAIKDARIDISKPVQAEPQVIITDVVIPITPETVTASSTPSISTTTPVTSGLDTTSSSTPLTPAIPEINISSTTPEAGSP
jgi:hypothetical protein